MSTTTLTRFFDILNDSSGASDARMDLFLMKSPLQFLTIVASYFIVVHKIGPVLMKNRKPFTLKNVIVAYNIVQIFWNAYIFLATLPLYRNRLNLFCSPHERTNSDINLMELRIHYCYLLLKYFDLVETVFYVMRKKDRQVSFLHVYHHIGILLAAFVSGKYFPGGQALYVAFYNSLIHCIMYAYYLMSSLTSNPQVLWWKRYVTILQIVQHCLIFLSVAPAVVNWNCSYPKIWMGLFSINVLVIIYLFARFYKKTYFNDNNICVKIKGL